MNGIKNLLVALSKGSDREDLSHIIFIDDNLYEIKKFFEDSYNIPVDYFYRCNKQGIKIELFIGSEVEYVTSEDNDLLKELIDTFDEVRRTAKDIKKKNNRK